MALYCKAIYTESMEEEKLKSKIHPEYKMGTISCACGNSFETHTTVGDMKVEICSACHPFFTGKQ